VIHVTGLTVYPIKSCGGTPVLDSVVTPRGLDHDRTFLVVAADGRPRRLRSDPGLAVVRPRVLDDGDALELAAPGHDPLVVEVRRTGARRGDPFTGIDQGRAAAAWFSAVLGADSHLVRLPPDWRRRTEGALPGAAGYADSTAVHLVSRSSVRALNDRLLADGHAAISTTRLRPNVVVDGWSAPHVEDRVRRLHGGSAEFGWAEDTPRCAVVGVDPERGVRTGSEPLRTMASYRRVGSEIVFGVNLVVLRPGRMAVGDEIVVGSWAAADRVPEPALP
jgi:uncharacterized protein